MQRRKFIKQSATALPLVIGLQSLPSDSLFSNSSGRSSRKDLSDTLVISANANGKKLNHYWSKCVGAGRANEGLRASWLEQLSIAQKFCGFKYCRFHGLFHDDMFVMRVVEGKTIYNWQYTDDLFDRMLAMDVRPFVELGFFPRDLSSAATCFWWGGHGTPPSNFRDWKELVVNFTDHCISRYGIGEVRKWYFEVWNEPNLNGFWNGTKEQYFEMYKITVSAIKAIDPALRVGGPATSSYHPDEGVYERLSKQKEITPEDFENIQCKGPWIEDFLTYCEIEKLPVDFVSSHPYPTTYPFDQQKNYFEMSRPVGCTLKDISWLKNTIEKSKFKDAGIELTEWSSSPSPRDFTHDYLQAATYIVKINLDCIGLANSLSYWTFTDVFEESGAGNSMFHGGFGLINYQGIVKPSFHAYRFLNMLGDEETFRKDEKLVTRDTKTGLITALIYNYPAEILTSVPISHENRILAEKSLHTGSTKTISITLTDLKPASIFEIEILDENNGFAITKWKEMGMPEPATREQTAQLKEFAMKTKRYQLSADIKGNLVWTETLSPWAVAVLRQVK